jgi:hypothetical protein
MKIEEEIENIFKILEEEFDICNNPDHAAHRNGLPIFDAHGCPGCGFKFMHRNESKVIKAIESLLQQQREEFVKDLAKARNLGEIMNENKYNSDEKFPNAWKKFDKLVSRYQPINKE